MSGIPRSRRRFEGMVLVALAAARLATAAESGVPAAGTEAPSPEGIGLRGRLLRIDDGSPVTDGAIEIYAEDPLGGLGGASDDEPRIEFGTDGRFEIFQMRSGGRYTLVASAPGLTCFVLAGLEIQEASMAAELQIGLDRGAAISGVVRGPDGSPIGGATITDQGQKCRLGAPGVALADASGRFQMTGLPSGRTKLTVAADGFATRVLPFDLSAQEAAMTSIVLARAARLVGRVTLEGSPLGGVWVSVGQASKQTNAEGEFILDQLPAGPASIEAWWMGDPTYQEPWSQEVLLAEGQESVVALDLAAGVTVTGLVTRAGERITSGVVRSRPRSDGIPPGSPIEPDGTFVLHGLRPGPLRLIVETAGDLWEERTVMVTESDARIELALASGSVQGVVREGGLPMPDCEVSLVPMGSERRFGGGGTTDASGSFVIMGVPAGAYELRVRRSLCEGEAEPEARVSLQVADGEALRSVSLELPTAPQMGSLSGRVAQPDGAPAALCIVEVQDATGRHITGCITDGFGRYFIGAVPVGTHEVTANGWSWYSPRVRGYGTALRRAVSVGRATVLDMVLELESVLKVKVCRNGKPYRGADVTLLFSGFGREETDRLGQASFGDLPTGDFILRVDAGDATTDVPVRLEAGRVLEVDVDVDRAAALP